MKFLMLTLHAPLASYGETVIGRHRSSWTRPGRSAVMGMIGAALGIEREQDTEHAALAAGLGYAVRTDAIGESLIDYHTFSVGQGVPAKRARTRRRELMVEKIETKPTQREYRANSLHTVALWDRASRWSLDQIADAIRRPHWTLYVGRRACVPALPLDPQIVEAETLQAAFALRPPLPAALVDRLQIRLDDHPEIAADAGAPGVTRTQIEYRRDGYHHTSGDLRTHKLREEWITEAPCI